MRRDRHYFFCGIGGSGMLPLALIVQSMGLRVSGSDRSLDQGRTAAKFDFLRGRGIPLFPQDGSGVTDSATVLVTSAAVEDTVPDVAAATRVGAARMTRADLLAEMFNAAPCAVGVAGTSGKSTTTGMIAWILHSAGRRPTVVNGAVMKNFVTDEVPFAGALVGSPDLFVCEVDESDGSIARFRPDIAVVNNVALDHKPLHELNGLFGDYCDKARLCVLNLDNDGTKALARGMSPRKALTYGLHDTDARLFADDITPLPDGIAFTVRTGGERLPARLRVPGRHNVANALAALSATAALGVPLAEAIRSLAGFAGIRRRLEVVGTARDVVVIDDFAHNPDKIAATLATLHDFPGRLLVLFQPHGFGPLKLMGDAFVDCFAASLGPDDLLAMPDPVYFGGTTDRAVGSRDIVSAVAARRGNAVYDPDRAVLGERLVRCARPGDRILVMGARDDSLSEFAGRLLARLSSQA